MIQNAKKSFIPRRSLMVMGYDAAADVRLERILAVRKSRLHSKAINAKNDKSAENCRIVADQLTSSIT